MKKERKKRKLKTEYVIHNRMMFILNELKTTIIWSKWGLEVEGVEIVDGRCALV